MTQNINVTDRPLHRSLARGLFWVTMIVVTLATLIR